MDEEEKQTAMTIEAGQSIIEAEEALFSESRTHVESPDYDPLMELPECYLSDIN